MKKIILLSATLILFFNLHMLAQLADVTADVEFNAELKNVFAINITGGDQQNAVFDTPAEYNLGIMAVGTTVFNVESLDDFGVDIEADAVDMAPVSGSGSLPVNNIGYWLTAAGSHLFDGNSLVLTQNNDVLATSKGLTNAPVRIIDPGSAGNAGGAAENNFNLNWTMCSMQNASMNTLSLFAQMALPGGPTLGTYQTIITLTATQTP